MRPRIVEGDTSGTGLRIGIVASRFNKAVVEGLLQGTLEELEEAGVAESDVIVVWVPGALELPLTVNRLARQREVDGLVALGCVIRGETAHFEHVGREAVAGLSRVSLESGIPVATGVLTVEDMEQARIRSGLDPDPTGGKEWRERHRGREAARACLEMINLLRRIEDEG